MDGKGGGGEPMKGEGGPSAEHCLGSPGGTGPAARPRSGWGSAARRGDNRQVKGRRLASPPG